MANKIVMENVQLIWKNFSGRETEFNEAGNRVFSVVIEDPKFATELLEEGWNVKPLTDDDGNITGHHLPVRLNFNSRIPPRVYRVWEDENIQPRLIRDMMEIDLIDVMPIKWVDIRINPYHWNEKGNIKAYVDTMYVCFEEDDLDRKWSVWSSRDDGDDLYAVE